MPRSQPQPETSHTAPFAGFLADAIAPRTPQAAERMPLRSETTFDSTQLEEDIASFSYERALRAAPSAAAGNAGPNAPLSIFELPQPDDAALRRTASITLRLSREESERIRDRAAEAGLTVSAYLRSCALEVDELRAQVKQTIAAMRTPQPVEAPSSPSHAPHESAQARSSAGPLSVLATWLGLRRALPAAAASLHFENEAL